MEISKRIKSVKSEEGLHNREKIKKRNFRKYQKVNRLYYMRKLLRLSLFCSDSKFIGFIIYSFHSFVGHDNNEMVLCMVGAVKFLNITHP